MFTFLEGRKMKAFKKWMALALAVLMMLQLPAGAADTPLIDDPHWHEVTEDVITAKYNAGDSFVVMYFRFTCGNSISRSETLKKLMEEYGLEVYGVDVDANPIPMWIGNELPQGSFMLPLICVVEKGAVTLFLGDSPLKQVVQKLGSFLGVDTDQFHYSFRRIDREVFQGYPKDETLIASKYLDQSGIEESIHQLARQITKGISSPLAKLEAIYKWVSSNIHYDYDMLWGYSEIQVSASWTLQQKRSVCEGYSNLTTALCRSAGIPCRIVAGFAGGEGEDYYLKQVWALYGDYLAGRLSRENFEQQMEAYANHSWNEAFAEGRWVIMDTTWGSGNTYTGEGGYAKGESNMLYFDPDLDFLAESHLFWGIEPRDSFAELIPGDINGDGKTNIFDVIRLLKLVTGEDVGFYARPDVNGDYWINIFDVIRLLKYVTGENVEIYK